MDDLNCPLCDWSSGPLFSGDPTERVNIADCLVTQYATLVQHMQDDHGAVIGGR